jgi:hypothetical protein
MVFKCVACLVLEKTLTNSKSCSERRIKFLFRLSFALIGQFILVYIHSWLSETFSESQAPCRKLSEEGCWKEYHN